MGVAGVAAPVWGLKADTELSEVVEGEGRVMGGVGETV